MAAKRNELELSAFSAAIHGSAKSGIAAGEHPVDIFHLGFSRMERVLYFLIVVIENILQDIHETIMTEDKTKKNPPNPS